MSQFARVIMLSTSILSYCNKLLDDDDLLQVPESSRPFSAKHATYRVRYLGAARCAKFHRRQLKHGITALQKPLTGE